MDLELEGFLVGLYWSGRDHDAVLENRLERLRNVEPETARLLGVLARGLRAKRLLELGTSFLDAERSEYVSYWPDLLRTLSIGGMLVVDNVISHEDEVAAFRKLVEGDSQVMDALAPSTSGPTGTSIWLSARCCWSSWRRS